MIDSLCYVVSFLFIITLIVFVHEFGHYIAARRAGVKILTFSIGMGPELFGFHDKHGTRWRFSLIPVGGYVMMLGDEDISSAQADENVEKLSDEEKKQAFHLKSNWQKMWISFCGPFANYIYAFVVMIFVFVFVGAPINTAEISNVMPDSPAYNAGLKEGDVIKTINGREVNRVEKVAMIINSLKEKSTSIVVNRNGSEMTFNVTPEEKHGRSLFGKRKVSKRIGVAFSMSRYEKVNLVNAVRSSFITCVDSTIMMYTLFKKLFSGRQSVDNLGGVVYMASVAGDIAKTGNFVMLLMFTVTLSLNLGFINLLPFPVVDGGNILVSLIEQCIGRSINRKLMNYIMSIGGVCLIFLMCLTTLNDILRFKVVNDWFLSLFN